MIRAEQFEQAPDDVRDRWAGFGKWERPYFPTFMGLVLEEVRVDYCRMRLPFRDELEQPAGVVHGGVIATILDSVVVPAVGSPYPAEARFSTVDMHVQYLSAAVQTDLLAEGWVVRRGRSVVFCESEVRAGDVGGTLIARSILTYNVSMGSVSP